MKNPLNKNGGSPAEINVPENSEFPDEYTPLESKYLEGFYKAFPSAEGAEDFADTAPESDEAAPDAIEGSLPVPEKDTAPEALPEAAPEAAEPEAAEPEAESSETKTAADASPEAPAVPEAAEAPETPNTSDTSDTSDTSGTSAAPATPFADLLGEPGDKDEPAPQPNSKKEKRRLKRAEKKAKKKTLKAKKKQIKRKGRFVTPLIILGVIIVAVLSCVLNIIYCKNNFEVNFYQVESMHVTSDVRIAVISDVHLSEYGEDNEYLVAAVKALHPDLIISAGDLVTYGEDDYDNMLSLCSQLAEIAPFYGIMGNHEDEKVYLENDKKLREKFKATGMRVLVNKRETIRINNNDIELVGISGGLESYDLYGGKDAMDKLEDNKTALRICIAHVPTLFTERLDEYDFDLGIAGHTHGGIVRLPLIGGLYSAEEGFMPEYDGGLYGLKNGAELFVSRGLGNSNEIPRFNNTPELAVIDVRWY